MNDLATRQPNGRIEFRPHAGQWQAWNSERRFVCVIAGTQSGKTSFGPHWLLKEIQRCGPGDYLVATPTFPLLEIKLLPELKRLFEQWGVLGKYQSSPRRKFVFSEEGSRKTFGTYDEDKPTTIWFGYAEDPDSLESATVKAAWLDEAGQKKFKLGSWEAILRRLSLAQGRILITTTPYDLGWLKQQVHDKWKAGHPDYDVIRFDSTENPQFPKEEFERARADLPKWKFDLFYRGIFTRPAGQIYDCFKDEYLPEGHKCRRFVVPDHWPRFLGLDFGGVNTAGMFYAEELDNEGTATGRLYAYREYHAGGRTAKQHAEVLQINEPSLLCVGGAQSEGQWRNEFSQSGLPVMPPPIKDVEVGINRVYAAHVHDNIVVFDDLYKYLEQKLTYSRELDDNNNATEKIADKETFHLMDAERYIISYLRSGRVQKARSPYA